jgi:hypothetical protein
MAHVSFCLNLTRKMIVLVQKLIDLRVHEDKVAWVGMNCIDSYTENRLHGELQFVKKKKKVNENSQAMCSLYIA